MLGDDMTKTDDLVYKIIHEWLFMYTKSSKHNSNP